jgi:hypothetical protein
MGPAPGDPRTDRAWSEVQDLGDLGVVEAGDIAEHHRGPELEGQLPEGRVEVEPVRDPVVEQRLAGRDGRFGFRQPGIGSA